MGDGKRVFKTSQAGMLIWTVAVAALHILVFKKMIDMEIPVWARALMPLGAVLITLPLHELIHFVFMKMFYRGKVVIETGKDPNGLPGLRTRPDEDFFVTTKKWQRAVCWLAPLFLLTVCVDIAIPFAGKAGLALLVIAVANCAGCYYDVFDVLNMLLRKG